MARIVLVALLVNDTKDGDWGYTADAVAETLRPAVQDDTLHDWCYVPGATPIDSQRFNVPPDYVPGMNSAFHRRVQQLIA